MAKVNKTNQKAIINRRARHDYDLIKSFLAGLVLGGHEVKALRFGEGHLRGAYVNFLNDELWLIGAHIAPYKNAEIAPNYDPLRNRKLLVNKKELVEIMSARQSGYSLVPIKLLTSGKYIKLEFATARGRKKHDQRQKITKRDHRKEIKNTKF